MSSLPKPLGQPWATFILARFFQDLDQIGNRFY
jgi:hypothetical protein